MDHFIEFWSIYPNQTGIGAARSAWSGEIFFKSADPLQMIKATKAFRVKHVDTEKRFIPRPCRYLQDQTYLDPDLNIEIVERTGPSGFWGQFTNDEIKEKTIEVPSWKWQHLMQKHEVYFEIARKLGYTIELQKKNPGELAGRSGALIR